MKIENETLSLTMTHEEARQIRELLHSAMTEVNPNNTFLCDIFAGFDKLLELYQILDKD